MAKVTTTIQINNDTTNPIAVTCAIAGDYEFPRGWDYEIEEIKSVELLISDKEGIDITKLILSNARAKDLILSQIDEEADQITDALSEGSDDNEQIDEIIGRAS